MAKIVRKSVIFLANRSGRLRRLAASGQCAATYGKIPSRSWTVCAKGTYGELPTAVGRSVGVQCVWQKSPERVCETERERKEEPSSTSSQQQAVPIPLPLRNDDEEQCVKISNRSRHDHDGSSSEHSSTIVVTRQRREEEVGRSDSGLLVLVALWGRIG